LFLSNGRPEGVGVHPFYASGLDGMIESFDRMMAPFGATLVLRFGDQAERIVGDARSRYRELVDTLPYIGGDDNPLTPALVSCARLLALYRVLQTRGVSVGEAGRLIYGTVDAAMATAPNSIAQGARAFARFCEDRRRGATASQRREYPGDWLYTICEGDGVAFDFGMDYTECGIVKWFHAQGADELTPYMCLLDWPLSRSMGSGLARTMTLAEGHRCCDFRFKRGRDIGPVCYPDEAPQSIAD
jgi:hypothetical protein